MAAPDPFRLARFVQAQDAVMPAVVAELRAGRKTTHWMWFVFPQARGLGTSGMAERYAIASLPEAAAYLDHGVLGPRLLACTAQVNAIEDRPIGMIFGSPDDLKFHACMTLFAAARPAEPEFAAALARYFQGVVHQATRALLASQPPYRL